MVSQRIAVASFALLGLVVAGLSAFSIYLLAQQPGPILDMSPAVGPDTHQSAFALALAHGTLGAFLAAAALTLFQPTRFWHWLLFSSAAAGLVTSIYGASGAAPQVLLTALLMIVGTVASLLTATRDRLASNQTTPNTLKTFYQEAVSARRIRQDPKQEVLVDELDTLAAAFQHYQRQRSRPWGFVYKAPQGLYLHGPAGRGKTFLLDAFYQTLPATARKRYHFHEIMAHLLDQLHEAQGEKQAIRRVAKLLAPPGSLVCLDELNLLDLTGARLLLALFDAWWQQGTVLCISSNMTSSAVFAGVAMADDERSQAILALGKHCQERELDFGQDYRANKLGAADLYQHPVTEPTLAKLRQIVGRLAEGPVTAEPLTLGRLSVPCISRAGGIAWFSYSALCESPLGYREYLELVTQFPTIIISNVPALTEEDPARRFAWLVELIYDAKKRLLVAADVPLPQLFASELSSTGEVADFGKIISRLQEMQSSEYNYVLATDA